MSDSICVYGDSILRATTPDDNFRYHFNSKEFFERIRERVGLSVVNRARMGALSTDGLRLVQRDAEKELGCAMAIVEYGGNDCDFAWNEISERPGEEHLPKTPLKQYLACMESIGEKLRMMGTEPVFLNLPPIDSQKYLSFITRSGLSRENILRWLGDVERIFDYQKMYSDAVSALITDKGWRLIDLRGVFMARQDRNELISADGIHPNMKGYELVFDTLTNALAI